MNPARCSRSVPSSLPRAARPARRCRARWRSPTSTTTASPAGASIVQEGSSMSTRNSLFALSLALAFGASAAVAETPGSGTSTQGAAVYSQKCAICHGENGVNPAAGVLPLVGPSKFDRIDTMKTVPYYKYATTLFDVMRRSMPYQMPKTLTNDELYALSAYILALNKIIGENDVMDAKTLPQVKMPNRDNFIIWAPDKI